MENSFVRNFIFVPQFRNGITPLGRFGARTFWWDDCWLRSSQLDYTVDLAFVIVNSDVERLTQSLSVSTNVAITAFIRTAGFPGHIADGQFLYQCSGVTCDTNSAFFRCNTQGPPNWSLGCQTAGGFSGAPYYLAAAGQNVMVGVESHSTLDGNGNRIRGFATIMNQRLLTIYNNANTASGQ